MSTSTTTATSSACSDVTARIRGITIDVSDRERSERFWGEVLGLTVSRRLDEYSYFGGAPGGVRLILQEVDDRKVTKNRMHLDVTTDDPDALLALVLELGGKVVADVEHPSYELTVAADPDGNEFCISRRPSGPLAELSETDTAEGH